MPTVENNPVKNAARTLNLTRVITAPRELIFQLWTYPQYVARWWGPRGFTNPVCQLDARPGGAIHIAMRGPDGTVYPMTGRYRDVVEPERLVFTSAALGAAGQPLFEVLTTVTFAEQAGGTVLTVEAHVVEATAAADPYLAGMDAGWTQSLERLATYAATVGARGNAGQPENTSAMTDRGIVISRVLDAPRELVWQAMSDPQHLVHWWGPRGFKTTIERLDFRAGGVWKQVMHGPDGTNYPNKSIYMEIVPQERVVYSHGGGREGGTGVHFVATWTLAKLEAAQTRLTVCLACTSAADRDRLVGEYRALEGGTQTLERLGDYLAKIPVVVESTFDAPLDVVWRALTDIDQMKQWYIPNIESFKPEVGFRTEFNVREDGKDYPHLWEITSVVPGRKIAYSWKFGGNPGDSVVTFELFPEGDTTRLKLTHEGLETFHGDENPALARGEFAKGWTNIIGTSLKEFVEKAGGAAHREFVFTRVFDAPREMVWKAWTEAAQLQRWFGPKGCAVPACWLDLRPGGIFHYCMQTPDGHEMWGKWTFREIVPPEKLVVIVSFSDAQGGVTRHPLSPTWPLETLSTMTLAEHAGQTELTLRWAPHAATEAERLTFDLSHESMKQGWTGTLDQLAAYLARG
ncbi:MAG TPA: SRPBCC family protein [Opitutaceae bacterium]|nr:SRPBCC family protein [Opitutaceae bacterium]